MTLKDKLNDRDILWLDYLAKGYQSNEIAEKLSVSRVTVDDSIARLLLKMGARNRIQAVAMATKKRLI